MLASFGEKKGRLLVGDSLDRIPVNKKNNFLLFKLDYSPLVGCRKPPSNQSESSFA